MDSNFKLIKYSVFPIRIYCGKEQLFVQIHNRIEEDDLLRIHLESANYHSCTQRFHTGCPGKILFTVLNIKGHGVYYTCTKCTHRELMSKEG